MSDCREKIIKNALERVFAVFPEDKSYSDLYDSLVESCNEDDFAIDGWEVCGMFESYASVDLLNIVNDYINIQETILKECLHQIE